MSHAVDKQIVFDRCVAIRSDAPTPMHLHAPLMSVAWLCSHVESLWSHVRFVFACIVVRQVVQPGYPGNVLGRRCRNLCSMHHPDFVW